MATVQRLTDGDLDDLFGFPTVPGNPDQQQPNIAAIPTNHFLALPRPDTFLGPATGAIDTTTLAAHDFDVDNRTGFMPPQPPLARLPSKWDAWEDVLSDARDRQLMVGESIPAGREGDIERRKSENWRQSVKTMPILPTKELRQSELYLRRAHHVLAWILHFYVHSMPPSTGLLDDIHIPSSLTLPLLRICAQLQLPPVLTYSDDVLYNWCYDLSADPLSTTTTQFPTPTTPLRCLTLFTQTLTESTFYLVSARIELIGVRALDLMRATMDELFVGDDIAVRRISDYLKALAEVIRKMKAELLSLKERGCEPEVFFKEVRPWLRGCEAGAKGGRKWVFDGLKEARERLENGEDEEEVYEPVELSGPSAGQSSLIHALDVFLGVDKWSHSVVPILHTPDDRDAKDDEQTPHPNPETLAHKSSFLLRMQQYMPRHHRHFLHHLAANTRPLREFILARAERGGTTGTDEGTGTQDAVDLVGSYNESIKALKEFRDAHMIIVALFIVGPAARARRASAAMRDDKSSQRREILRGTGGTDIVQFLKTVRDQTKNAVLTSASST